jgi:4'-phosphopantetheinyl transferase
MAFPDPLPWTAAPPAPSLEPGWAHVFRLTLDLPAQRMQALHGLLSADEQERAARYHFDIDRRRFTAARGQIREILAAYLSMPAQDLAFFYNPQGKPSLPGGRLCFNLSHTLGIGLLAVTQAQETGIDVEGVNRKVDSPGIASRFFAPAETNALFALPEADRARAFFDCWTRKEAYIKARGLGLSIPLDSFEVGLEPGKPPTLRAPDEGWSIYALDPGSGFTAALVVQGSLKGIRCWDWGGSIHE